MSRIVNLQKLFLKNGEDSAIENGKSYTGVIPDEGIQLGRTVVLRNPDGTARMNTSLVEKIIGKSEKHVLFTTTTSMYLLTYL